MATNRDNAGSSISCYYLMPEHNILGGNWVVYPPGSAIPEPSKFETFTNKELFLKLIFYPIGYYVVVLLTYFFLARAAFVLSKKWVYIHLVVTVVGIIILIPLNDFVLFVGPSGIPDLYFSGSSENHDPSMKQLIGQMALTTKKSIVALSLIFVGLLVLIINIYQSRKKASCI